MRFYDGDSSYSSGYEKIKAYYPRFYYGVAEMEALWRFFGYVSDNIEHEIESAVQNAFIDTADLNTISRIEEFIGVDSTAVTPEERRSVIKNHLYGYGKLSASRIAAALSTYTTASVDIALEPFDSEGNNRLNLRFECGDTGEIKILECVDVIETNIPAHLSFLPFFTFNNTAKFGVGFADQSSIVLETTTPEVDVHTFLWLTDENSNTLVDENGSVCIM